MTNVFNANSLQETWVVHSLVLIPPGSAHSAGWQETRASDSTVSELLGLECDTPKCESNALEFALFIFLPQSAKKHLSRPGRTLRSFTSIYKATDVTVNIFHAI